MTNGDWGFALGLLHKKALLNIETQGATEDGRSVDLQNQGLRTAKTWRRNGSRVTDFNTRVS